MADLIDREVLLKCHECLSSSPKVERDDYDGTGKAYWAHQENRCRQLAATRDSDGSNYGQLAKALCGNENASVEDCMDAINQLRCAEQPNRVLTLDEIKRMESEVDSIVWYENKELFYGWGEPVGSRSNASVHYIDCPGTDEGVRFTDEAYGKNIRCWLRKPIDDERQNTPWEV